MELSCILAPHRDTPEHIELAERLGYSRAWCFDTPALCSDVWMTLALAAERTTRIGLAPGMLVPSLRHPMVNATAIRTLENLAPGRVAVGFGSGLTGRRLVGEGAMKWADVVTYVREVRTLLAGGEIERNGKLIRHMPPDAFGAAEPIRVPFVLAVEGPRGIQSAVASQADGIATNGPIPAEFTWGMRVVFAAVLDDEESVTSDRAWSWAGPGAALVYHISYDMGGAAGVDQLPGGAAWRGMIEDVPLERRHQEHWEGHLVEPNAYDTKTIPREVLGNFAMIGTPQHLREQIAVLEDNGVTEIGFTPSGANVAEQLARFAQAALG